MQMTRRVSSLHSLCFKVCIFLLLPTKKIFINNLLDRKISFCTFITLLEPSMSISSLFLWIYAYLHFFFIKMTNKNMYLSGLKKMKSKGSMDAVTHLPPQLPSPSGTVPFFLELSSISNFQKTKAYYCWTPLSLSHSLLLLVFFLSHHFRV